MVGQTGGQWVSPAVSVVDGRAGTDLTSSLGQVSYGFGYFYGTQRGIFAASKNKAFVISNGLSPADISFFTLDPATGAINQAGDSPYHGDYAMGAPFFLSSDENLLFTASGNYFRTDTLQYAGKFSMTGFLQSMSQSVSANEAIVLSASYDQSGNYPYPVVYEPSYHRFTDRCSSRTPISRCRRSAGSKATASVSSTARTTTMLCWCRPAVRTRAPRD